MQIIAALLMGFSTAVLLLFKFRGTQMTSTMENTLEMLIGIPYHILKIQMERIIMFAHIIMAINNGA